MVKLSFSNSTLSLAFQLLIQGQSKCLSIIKFLNGINSLSMKHEFLNYKFDYLF